MSPEESDFLCARCGGECGAEAMGKTDEKGRPLCIPCSLEITASSASTSTRRDIEKRQARAEAVEELREKRRGSRRLTAALLLLGLPVIGIELFLLLDSRPPALTPAEVAEIELTESAIMVTVLEQYRDEHGRFPPSLDALVPDFWSAEDAAELVSFQYAPVGVDDFRLTRSGSALPAPLVGQALDQDLLPASMTAETNFDAFYHRIDEAR